MRERRFCTEIVGALKTRAWAYKIPDPSAAHARSVQRPFDIVCVRGGQMYAFECKVVGKEKGVRLPRHQYEHLCAVERQGAEAYLVIRLNSRLAVLIGIRRLGYGLKFRSMLWLGLKRLDELGIPVLKEFGEWKIGEVLGW